MRRYDDPVEVRKGLVAERGDHGDHGGQEEGPAQFLWRGRLWKVRAVLAHWVETGPWWQSAGAKAVIGSDEPGADDAAAEAARDPRRHDLLAEREVWRVEAARGSAAAAGHDGADGGGVFDLSFDWHDGTWLLVGCAD